MKIKTKWTCILLMVVMVMACVPFLAQAQVTADGLEQLFVKLDTGNNGNWYKDSNNEYGVLAWDESYVMRAYLEMYEATGNIKYLDKFVVHADSVLKQRDSVRGVKDYRGLSLPAWGAGGDYTGNGTLKIFEVHTGIIASPYARFAAIVKNNTALAAYQSKAAVYLKAAKDAVAVHDAAWTETATEMYLNRPFNFTLAMGQAFLEIYRASGESIYYNRAVKIANYFKNNLSIDSAANSYYWRYMKSGSYTGYEDLTHGAIDVDFVNSAYQSGVVFTEADMQKFGNTVQKKILKSDKTIADKVTGTGTSPHQTYVGLWLFFDKWAPSLFDVSYEKVASKTRVVAEELLCVAYMNKAFSEKNGGLPQPSTDVTSPHVVDNVPAAGSQVPVNVKITVKFSEPVKNVTVNTFRVEGVTGTVTYNSATNSAVFAPNTVLGYAADYNVTVTSGVTDLAGNALAPFSWQFKTEPAPQAAAYLKNGDFSAGKTGWSGTQVVVKQEGANWYGQNSYNWAFFQDVKIPAGTYQVTAKTQKGTSKTEARIVVVAIDAGGKRTVIAGTTYSHKGTGWETMPETVLTVPNGTVTTRIYLLTNGGTGYHNFDDIALKAKSAPEAASLLINGSFSDGKTGWSGTQVVVKQEGTNFFGANSYNWAFFQDVKVPAGNYRISAKTKKGTSKTEARIVVVAIDAGGKRTVIAGTTYSHKGTGWEAMPETMFTVPNGTVTTRIYLLTNGGSGYHYFDDLVLKPAV